MWRPEQQLTNSTHLMCSSIAIQSTSQCKQLAIRLKLDHQLCQRHAKELAYTVQYYTVAVSG